MYFFKMPNTNRLHTMCELYSQRNKSIESVKRNESIEGSVCSRLSKSIWCVFPYRAFGYWVQFCRRYHLWCSELFSLWRLKKRVRKALFTCLLILALIFIKTMVSLFRRILCDQYYGCSAMASCPLPQIALTILNPSHGSCISISMNIQCLDVTNFRPCHIYCSVLHQKAILATANFNLSIPYNIVISGSLHL